MKAGASYYIKRNKPSDSPMILIVTDENPEGVTLTVKDNSIEGSMTSFNLPRIEMIEALEYIVKKLKTTI